MFNIFYTLPIYSIDNQHGADSHQNLTVLDVPERDIGDWDSLAVTFSSPLNENQNFEDKMHLVDKETGKVVGAWILSKDRQELIFSHLEPDQKLILTIDPELQGNDGKILKEEYHTSIQTKNLKLNIGFAS